MEKAMLITGKQVSQIKELLLNLDWECDRMTDEGVETFEKLCKIFKVE